MKNYFLNLSCEKKTIELGNELGLLCYNQPVNIYLYGDLGSGKTTFVRGFLRASGYYGIVKSPTYTFVESYKVYDILLYHIDLYRINNQCELDSIGICEYFGNTICLVEWPQCGKGMLPLPDLKLVFHYIGDKRKVQLIAYSSFTKYLLEELYYLRNK
ncbi:tRNA (adenosine(37)-N6)-threonylcarbamoyltransferase complex ATPase subunit type 1 TsaE [Candidatus Pantoea edessiphila]|uniref:tRNA threonylcarbamoyladenosine biosynthesis protein TsaE n=1 Tax=Candidatus Pantoea edessiphila TaxID=2044610 RepID=A0A2P5SZN8_9GAMM|nr:tRNA (adenosine(37)-N6)-threonylcarbamoyltransferase complex ATPase subunit type 1 TsaE [Candidatus Pantoea edessiphila]PPI87808.1 tRNA (adenosine(37)-N6)-threonylcarbamoyltransferase complex ATPase subunit type 1 TsaE [Candidatus Pantoea edessiphila]